MAPRLIPRHLDLFLLFRLCTQSPRRTRPSPRTTTSWAKPKRSESPAAAATTTKKQATKHPAAAAGRRQTSTGAWTARPGTWPQRPTCLSCWAALCTRTRLKRTKSWGRCARGCLSCISFILSTRGRAPPILARGVHALGCPHALVRSSISRALYLLSFSLLGWCVVVLVSGLFFFLV